MKRPQEVSPRACDPPVLPYARQCLDQDDLDAVLRVLRGDWLTQGPTVAAFEQALAQACGARYAVAVSSGTAALHLACIVAGVGPGDIGVTSPITFVASANCVAYCGGTPCFADIDPRTATLDPVALEEVCARRHPRVIIPVHFAGQPADMPAIRDVARRHGASVIEDAAHALGASYRHEGQMHRVGACAHSEMAIFSFHAVKHITTGEGGAILTNSPEHYRRLLRLRSHGITKELSSPGGTEGPWYYEQLELGFHYRITDIQCALGLSQLAKLARFVERRRALVEAYREGLKHVADEIELGLEIPGRRSSYHLLVGRIQGGSARRRAVYDGLHAWGIRAQLHYYPVHLQPWYRDRYGYQAGAYPRAEAYYESCLSLPLFPGMSDGDVERVVGAVRETLAETAG